VSTANVIEIDVDPVGCGLGQGCGQGGGVIAGRLVVDHCIDPDLVLQETGLLGAAALTAALAEAAPDGIDVYFDNVGGGHLEAALNAARPYARFAICGMISMYNAEAPVPGPSNMALIIGKNLRLEGFIVSTHWDMRNDFLKELGAWHSQGKLKWRQTVLEGIASAPDAFIGLFTGANMGKMLVKLA